MFNKVIRRFSTIHLSTPKPGIQVLTLNNPEKRNPLSMSTMTDLERQLDQIGVCPETRVIIINSKGAVFSSGHDLKEIANIHHKEQHHQIFSKLGHIIHKMQALPQPIIGQIDDAIATAAGLQLLLACDIVVASIHAKFATSGIKLGLFCSTPGVQLVRNINNQKKAFEMLCTGDPVTAEEAFQLGMINRVVDNNIDKEKVYKESIELAESIMKNSREGISIGKNGFYHQCSMKGYQEAYNYTSQIMIHNLHTEDCQKGLKKFVKK